MIGDEYSNGDASLCARRSAGKAIRALTLAEVKQAVARKTFGVSPEALKSRSAGEIGAAMLGCGSSRAVACSKAVSETRQYSTEDGKMSDTLRAKGARLAELITSAPTEAREKFHLHQQAAVDAEHQAFKKAYDQRNCYLCGAPLTSLDEEKPCAHWLLNPEGFRKKRHFALVTEKYGFHRLQSFLRWLAAQEGGPKNINDLPEEGTDKLREVTIRYRDLEWSFSCALNDFNGHGSGSHQSPHYHFQMRHGNRIVIRYNDFHVPFSEQDILEISAEMASPDLRRRWSHGEGMKDFFLPEAIDAMLDAGGFSPTGEGDGDVHFDYFIKADEGTTMSGDDIHVMIEEAKASGVSLGTLLRRGRLPNVTVETYATPGPGVVEQKSRSGRGGKAEG